MSAGMASMSEASGLTRSSCCNCSIIAIGSLGRPRIIAIMSPSSGNGVIKPMTVFFGKARLWTSFVRSYSRKRSRSGAKKAMTC